MHRLAASHLARAPSFDANPCGTLPAMRRPPARKLLPLATFVVIVGLAVSCGGSGSSARPGTPLPTGAIKPNPGSGSGSLIIARPEGFVEYDIKGASQKPLITAPDANTFLLDPALSPDAKHIAYIVQPPPKVEGNKYDAGSDLWVANRNGTDPHVVFTHVQPNQLIRFPQWETNDRILAIVQEISTKNGITSVVYTLERIDPATGQRSNVLEDVLAFAISPDGKRVAYAKLAPQAGETLESQDIGGGNARTLVPQTQNLTPFNAPRFSPDGTKLAFASADQTGAVAPFQLVSLDPEAPLATQDAVALLDGLPEDIWTIDADAPDSVPVRIADLKEDLPWLTWDGSGKHVYVVGSAGLYDVNVETGAVTRLSDGAFHAQLTWAP
jgi:dipeptidyl aminopeptidase/acylaminoacyl peptidase